MIDTETNSALVNTVAFNVITPSIDVICPAEVHVGDNFSCSANGTPGSVTKDTDFSYNWDDGGAPSTESVNPSVYSAPSSTSASYGGYSSTGDRTVTVTWGTTGAQGNATINVRPARTISVSCPALVETGDPVSCNVTAGPTPVDPGDQFYLAWGDGTGTSWSAGTNNGTWTRNKAAGYASEGFYTVTAYYGPNASGEPFDSQTIEVESGLELPVANVSCDKSTVTVGESLTCTLSWTEGTHPVATRQFYEDGFSGQHSGSAGTSPWQVTFSYSTVGNKTPRGRVRDSENNWSSYNSFSVEVEPEPTSIGLSCSPSQWSQVSSGSTINCTGTASEQPSEIRWYATVSSPTNYVLQWTDTSQSTTSGFGHAFTNTGSSNVTRRIRVQADFPDGSTRSATNTFYIQPEPTASAPTVSCYVDPNEIEAGDSSGTVYIPYDGNGAIVTEVTWNVAEAGYSGTHWPNQETGTVQNIAINNQDPGTYTYTVTATNSEGTDSDTCTYELTGGDNPPLDINLNCSFTPSGPYDENDSADVQCTATSNRANTSFTFGGNASGPGSASLCNGQTGFGTSATCSDQIPTSPDGTWSVQMSVTGEEGTDDDADTWNSSYVVEGGSWSCGVQFQNDDVGPEFAGRVSPWVANDNELWVEAGAYCESLSCYTNESVSYQMGGGFGASSWERWDQPGGLSGSGSGDPNGLLGNVIDSGKDVDASDGDGMWTIVHIGTIPPGGGASHYYEFDMEIWGSGILYPSVEFMCGY